MLRWTSTSTVSDDSTLIFTSDVELLLGVKGSGHLDVDMLLDIHLAVRVDSVWVLPRLNNEPALGPG
ncbi:hypothetical protein NDU88_003494 [Pleurodeles waltl]|uniref:Uncharacterized protein n=1 Tax=Pleurodeles waltl TaxID=8319 RepID=A0AAV7MB81_PLEWA|nr:hypothetical protein NDU88_003494 [Pleurodeles waltl]